MTEKIGLELEVLNQKALKRFEEYIAEINKVNKAHDHVAKSAAKASQSLSKVDGALGKGGGGFSKISGLLSGELGNMAQKAIQSVPALSKVQGMLGGVGMAGGSTVVALGAVAAGFVATTAAAAGFFALGKRGAELQSTITAFGNITSGAGDSTSVLEGLRQQTRGVIGDLELMRLTTLSLQGTSQGFRSVVAPNIGSIIDITNRVAQATGQSADVVREKFFLGLRRQSKLLLDDVGVVVDKTSAEFKKLSSEIGDEAAYAQLAIENLKEVGAEVGGVNAVLEAIKRPMVFLQNSLDRLSLAVQPAFAPIALVIGNVTDKLEHLASFVFPLVEVGAKIVGQVLTSAFSVASTVINTLFGPAIDGVMLVLPYLVVIAQWVGDAVVGAISGIGNAINSVIGGISSVVSGALSFFGVTRDSILGDTDMSISTLAAKLGRGGGQIIGAFAAGMASAATNVVNVVTKIAQIVADFLQGFSPPERGPLSTIDTGGANVIKAWSDGMLAGFVNPADKVAEMVNSRLGSIASMSGAQVAARLAELDSAIRPFREQADLAKADFEAMAGFADPLTKALERQQQKAVKAAGMGGDIEQVRMLDAQLERVRELKDLAEARNDQAQIDLAFAEAQQAEERALLKIQQERVGTATAGGGAGGSGGEKADKMPSGAAPKKGGGGGGAAESGGGGLPAGGAAPNLLTNAAIENARANMSRVGGIAADSFNEAFQAQTGDAFGKFDVARGGLDAQLARIKSADPVQKIKDKFSGLADTFTQPLADVKTKFDEVFGAEGTIATSLNALDLVVSTFRTNVSTKLSELTTNASLYLTPLFTGAGILSGTGTISTALTSVEGAFGTFRTNASSKISELVTNIGLYLAPLTAEGGILSATGTFAMGLTGMFGEGGVLSLLFANASLRVSEFKDSVSGYIDDISAKFSSVFSDPVGSVQMIVTNIADATEEALAILTSFAGADGVGTALSTFGTTISGAMIAPTVNAMNAIIQSIEDAINGAIREANRLLGKVGMSAGDEITIPRVSVPAFAQGGVLKGTGLVGEQGPELITTRKPSTIFPANVTRSLMSRMAAPQPMYVPSNVSTNNTYNNQRSVTNNFNVSNMQDMMLIQRQQEAMF